MLRSTRTRSGRWENGEPHALEPVRGVDDLVAIGGQELADEKTVARVVLDVKHARHGRLTHPLAEARHGTFYFRGPTTTFRRRHAFSPHSVASVALLLSAPLAAGSVAACDSHDHASGASRHRAHHHDRASAAPAASAAPTASAAPRPHPHHRRRTRTRSSSARTSPSARAPRRRPARTSASTMWARSPTARNSTAHASAASLSSSRSARAA